MPIAKIGKSLHCSQRTIERAFLRVTNLTLKQYQSMIRLDVERSVMILRESP